MKKTLQIGNGIALIATIVMNYLSNTGIFNGKTMADISGQYENLFTPAGYAFSIWGLIYLMLLGFAIYQARNLFKSVKEEDNTVQQIGWWFIVSCIANSLWVVVFLYDQILLSVVIIAILLISLLKIVVNTRMELDNPPLKKFVFVWWPFCIYAGWVSVAIIANISAYLTKIDWNGFGISEITWAIIMIIIAGLVNIFMIWNRNMREFGLVGIWALIAIAVANWNGLQSVVYASLIVAGIIFINISVHGYKNRKANPFIKIRDNK